MEVILNGGSTGEIITASNFLETCISQRSPEKSFKFGKEILKSTQTNTFVDPVLRIDARYLGLAASAGRNYIDYTGVINFNGSELISSTDNSSSSQRRYIPLNVPYAKSSYAFEYKSDVEAFLAKVKYRLANEGVFGPCDDLFQAIQDTHQELEKRFADMMNDMRTGYQYFQNDPAKWRNYQERYNNVRTFLRMLTKSWDDSECPDMVSNLQKSLAVDMSKAVLSRNPPDKPLPSSVSDFSLPDWATAAGVTLVGGVVTIWAVGTLPAWGLGVLAAMTAALGFQLIVN